MPLGGHKMLLSREWAESTPGLTKCHSTSNHHTTTNLLRSKHVAKSSSSTQGPHTVAFQGRLPHLPKSACTTHAIGLASGK